MAQNSTAIVVASSLSDIRAAARTGNGITPPLPARGCGFWTLERELKLVDVKTAEFNKVTTSMKYRLKSIVVKWEYCATELEKIGVTSVKGDTLKRKWTNMVSDFKKINDWQKRSGACNWWDMSSDEKKEAEMRMVKIQFEQELFDKMNALLGKRYSVNPPIILDAENMDDDKNGKRDEDRDEFSIEKTRSSSNKSSGKKDAPDEKPSGSAYNKQYSRTIYITTLFLSMLQAIWKIHEEMVRGNVNMEKMVDNLQESTMSFLQVMTKVAESVTQNSEKKSV